MWQNCLTELPLPRLVLRLPRLPITPESHWNLSRLPAAPRISIHISPSESRSSSASGRATGKGFEHRQQVIAVRARKRRRAASTDQAQPRVALMILWSAVGVTFLMLCLSRLMGVHLAVTHDGTWCL